MRPVVIRAAALLAALLGLVLAAPARAASPPPIVRPDQKAASSLELGRQLFAANCSTCHGSLGRGVRPGATPPGAGDLHGAGPSLIGVGSLATDFYLRTGYMPLGDPGAQPTRSRPQLDDREIRAVEQYVGSLSATPGPGVPSPHPERGSVADGLKLFTEHCAGCHQVVAEGGVVTGARVPPLSDATPTQIAEAVRIGPYVMPAFSRKDISDADLNSIVRYVRYAAHPDDRGGWGINHLGPFPEGLVTGAVVLLLLVG
ncbi:MAG TPA: c-type cytochrome, partial [Solirubrobacteraceae bacterium]|nr:c-type cytochrome [Solirubrobacteraceae bacterium]